MNWRCNTYLTAKGWKQLKYVTLSGNSFSLDNNNNNNTNSNNNNYNNNNNNNNTML